jgi:hypothetical protein
MTCKDSPDGFHEYVVGEAGGYIEHLMCKHCQEDLALVDALPLINAALRLHSKQVMEAVAFIDGEIENVSGETHKALHGFAHWKMHGEEPDE